MKQKRDKTCKTTRLTNKTLHTIAIATDAWFLQVNRVARTPSRTKKESESRGFRIEVISLEGYRSVPCLTNPEIRLLLFALRSAKKRLTHLKPDAVHIAKEGPLGLTRGAGVQVITYSLRSATSPDFWNRSDFGCQFP